MVPLYVFAMEGSLPGLDSSCHAIENSRPDKHRRARCFLRHRPNLDSNIVETIRVPTKVDGVSFQVVTHTTGKTQPGDVAGTELPFVECRGSAC